MGKGIRYRLAIICAKAVGKTIKLLGKNGTHFPGIVALKICPDFFKKTNRPQKLIAVMGTNGKTTVANLIIDILEDNGYKTLNNQNGGNIREGICATLISGLTVFGKCRYDTAVLEVDEKISRFVLPYLKPELLVCTNLFRDSFKRNAHSEFIADIINNSISPNTKLILNGDDLISSRLALSNDRVYFGVAPIENEVQVKDNIVCDMVVCPECQTRLTYDYQRYNHIGRAHCEKCGFSSPNTDYLVDSVDYTNNKLEVVIKGQKETFKLIGKNIVDIYNSVSAIALLSEFGLETSLIKDSFEKINLVKSRYNENEIKGKRVIMNLAKGQNPIACSRVFDFIRKNDGNISVVLIVDDYFDAAHTSENIAWIYDTDFEFLNRPNIKQIVIGGVRSSDYRLRLLLAGIDNEKIVTVEKELDTANYVDIDQSDKIFVLYDVYTIHLAESTVKRISQRIEEEK